MANRLRGSATYATSTLQKMKAYAGPGADFGYLDLIEGESRSTSAKAEFVPVYVALGLIALSTTLGLVSAKQQLLYAPNVRLKKKLRETIPEVVFPDKAVDEGNKFIEKSFFRKVAHVQELGSGLQYIPDPTRKDIFAHPLRAETLKSVGIDPQQL